MKSKEFVLDNQFKFVVTKRRSSRHMRISIGSDGVIKVSIPAYIPYSAAIAFAKSKRNWIIQHQPEIKIYKDGMAIGKSHHLLIKPDSTISKIQTRLKDTEAILYIPIDLEPESEIVQKAVKALAARAYKVQATSLLPIRVDSLANKLGFTYNELRYRNLKNRWGSCDQNKNITLNINLMELPWHLIDYVIIHELNHTKYLNHSQDFWANMQKMLPATKELRKELKTFRARS
jgi:predicted metal-dependent hydrolase